MYGLVRLFFSYLIYYVFKINIFIKKKYGLIIESEFFKVLFWYVGFCFLFLFYFLFYYG